MEKLIAFIGGFVMGLIAMYWYNLPKSKVSLLSYPILKNKKAIAPILSAIAILVLLAIFIVPLFKASSTATGLLGNPIIVLLIIIGFFLWAIKGK